MWFDRAACRGMTHVMFDPKLVEKAKALCSLCPHIIECEAEADRTHSYYGIWGGKAPYERNPLPEYVGKGVMVVIQHENGRLFGYSEEPE